MGAKIIVLFLITSFAYLQICDAVKCYNCQSRSSEKYVDDKDDVLPVCGSLTGSTQAIDCPSDTICQYFEISANNTRTTVRTCAPLDGCDEFPIEDMEKIENCFTCDEDLCNKKSKQSLCSTLKMDINLNVNLNVRNYNDDNSTLI